MKQLLFFLISLYQLIVSPFIHAVTGSSTGCRYNPTCSEYAKEVIRKDGIRKGSILALKRLLTCHPFARYNTTT